MGLLENGRRGRNRTCNPQIRNLMLYPFELRAPVIDNTSRLLVVLTMCQPFQRFFASAENRKVAPGKAFHLIVELARQAEDADQG